MNRLAIIGSGDLGQQVAHIAVQNGFDVIGYFDDFADTKSDEILGSTKDIQDQYNNGEFDSIFVAVGYNHMDVRVKLFNSFFNKIPFANVIHKSAFIDASVELGTGILIYPNVAIDSNSTIGNNVLINIGSTIAHDTKVGDHSFLSPRVALAGFIEIGDECILGINSTVIDNITIANKTQLGGGTVVIKTISKSGLYVGNPARFIK